MPSSVFQAVSLPSLRLQALLQGDKDFPSDWRVSLTSRVQISTYNDFLWLQGFFNPILWILSTVLISERKFYATLSYQLLHQPCQNSTKECFQTFQSVHDIIRFWNCTTHLFHNDIEFNQLFSIHCTLLCFF